MYALKRVLPSCYTWQIALAHSVTVTCATGSSIVVVAQAARFLYVLYIKLLFFNKCYSNTLLRLLLLPKYITWRCVVNL